MQELSLNQVANQLVISAKNFRSKIKSEEDLKIAFEKNLDEVSKSIGLQLNSTYERSVFQSGRYDAKHGQVIIEYEPPFSFSSERNVNHAFEQLIGYIEGEAKTQELFIFDPKLIGVGFDGEQIFFARFHGDKTVSKITLDKKDFIIDGPFEFNEQSAVTFLTYLRSLNRKLLNAENLAESFGPESILSKKIVSAFANALEYWDKEKPRVRTFFGEWKRLFGIIYGENPATQKEGEILKKLYPVGKDTDFQELLFCVHTYFAFLMKLIAVELLSLRDEPFSSSFSAKLFHQKTEELKSSLLDMEEGGTFLKKGITNFLEGDFFRWYTDTWSPELEDAIRQILKQISEFEPATTIIKPDQTKDLLKKLYQYLVPREVRHKLGEYYTPDWLAELMLNQVGYDGNTLKTLLDPACGSGTFLVLAIKRAKEYAKKHHELPLETAKRIRDNIWGFDLNPLAIIAARTNYLFAMGDLIQELKNGIEIPIYLADSVLWPQERIQQMELMSSNLQGENYKIHTSVKDFHVPKNWLNDHGFFLKMAVPILENAVKEHWQKDEIMKRFEKEGLITSPLDRDVIENFYEEILELEKEGRNGIWAKFLKNAFVPMIVEKFDFVVGNPPWIRWGYLSEEYRAATLNLWKSYGLFSLSGQAARLGGGEKDFSMLFTLASIDHYLKDDGILGFLITQELFKSKGAGEGFRRFKLNDKEFVKVIKALDLVDVQPFEGAVNKTAAIFLKKGQETTYPVSYEKYERKKGVGKIAPDTKIEDALKLLSKKHLEAQPIAGPTSSWQTIDKKQADVNFVKGKNAYMARQGADTQPYGVFLIEIKNLLSNNEILVSNLNTEGKTEIPKVEQRIENDLVFPTIRGKDIQKWQTFSKIFVLMVQNPEKREPFSELWMKAELPRTYTYLLNFKNILLARKSKSIQDLAGRTAFYSMFGIGNYTVAPYKVVWKLMSKDLSAAVISQKKTILGYKNIIPTKTVSLIASSSEDEAHYLCAVINSASVNNFVKSFSSAGRGFGTPSVMNEIGIPKFNPQNALHIKLSTISMKCHDLKEQGAEKEISKLEKENDELVEKLFKKEDPNTRN